jgi:hypothetical protein
MECPGWGHDSLETLPGLAGCLAMLREGLWHIFLAVVSSPVPPSDTAQGVRAGGGGRVGSVPEAEVDIP